MLGEKKALDPKSIRLIMNEFQHLKILFLFLIMCLVYSKIAQIFDSIIY